MFVATDKASFERMRAYDTRKDIVDAEGVIRLFQIRNGSSHDERVEDDILHSLDGRREGNNARRSDACHKALRSQRGSNATSGLADIVGISHIAESKLIDRCRTKCLRVAKADELRAAQIKGIESRNAGAALASRVGIVQGIVVEEIIGGEKSPSASIRIYPQASPCHPVESRP